MSQTTTVIPYGGDLTGWQAVKHYADFAGKFERCKLACQVMAGFALIELHDGNRVRPGQPKKELPNDSVILSWPELVRENAGISDDTARNWMKMAEGAKPRLKKLDPSGRLRELIALPPSEWSATDNALIEKTVHKLTDGKTQLEFMWELGTAKKPQGSGAKGGGPGGSVKKNLSLEEQIEIRVGMAREDFCPIRIEASNRSFIVLDDFEINAQIGLLETAVKARLMWLNQPKAKRDFKAVEQFLKR